MKKPTILTSKDLQEIIDLLGVKASNVEELVNHHKTVKFHKVSSFRNWEKLKKGELKVENEFKDKPSFKRKIETLTKNLSEEIEASLIKKKKFINNQEIKENSFENEDIFMKIPSRFSIGDQVGN